MGLVYEAWDDRLGRSIALKVMRPALQDVAVRERFWREARAAGALSHPNICHVYEIGEDEGELFIAMERLDGESLAERLSAGRSPPAEAIQVALGILAGLEAVHARGLLHRDLKPSNVFLTPARGQAARLRSRARGLDDPGEHDHTRPALTLPGVVMGTPAYMAPEQILGQPADARADLYAVGAILFEMLAGRPPFQAPTPAEILARVLSERPPALGGSPLVARPTASCTAPWRANRDERYADAAAWRRTCARRCASSRAARRRPSGRSGAHRPAVPAAAGRPGGRVPAFGLADAITASLAGTAGLVVRSSLAAARYAGRCPSSPTLAAEVDVDLVVSGTLLRAGERIRVVGAARRGARRHGALVAHAAGRPHRPLPGAGRPRRHVVESVSASLGTQATRGSVRRAGARTSCTCAATSWRSTRGRGWRRAPGTSRPSPRTRSTPGLGAPRPHLPHPREVRARRGRVVLRPGRRGAAAARWSSIPTCRWRSRTARSSTSSSGGPGRRSSRLCRSARRGTPPTRTSWPASSTPRATPGSSRSRRRPRARAPARPADADGRRQHVLAEG
jgi:hypothetical protein